MHIFSVSQFIEFLNDALVTLTPRDQIAIEGEVSGFNIAQEQWVRFDLKDESGLINCFLTVWQLKQPLEDGMKIRVRGYPKVYPKYGKFSFVVQEIELAGEGSLKRAFELLKKKLAAEGLFAPERKRILPRFPKRVALITSAEAAAYTDFIRILNNRWAGVEVNLYHTAVQGASAVGEIVKAFAYFNEHAEAYDVLVLVRGGGSMEDLQAFNSEEIARAIYGCRIPVVVGVGHERDETLADYVADVRASTPSNAAERVVPSREEIFGTLNFTAEHLCERMLGRAREPLRAIEHAVYQFDHFWREVGYKMNDTIRELRGATEKIAQKIVVRRAALNERARVLQNVDPQRVLGRGYSVVYVAGRVLKDAAQVDTGGQIRVQLNNGALLGKVISKEL
ncbi:MAG: Exodeoxyribonuclease 7 large subunit [Candidatus Magasanikbacteria bacterium]|nr:Exodeoxyribonuclease 7 large subunit [Candidatus Magasanikbacteria bacterium]